MGLAVCGRKCWDSSPAFAWRDRLGSERRFEPTIYWHLSTRLGRSVWCTSTSYAKDGRFETRSGNWVSWRWSFVFCSSSANLDTGIGYLKIGNDNFLPYLNHYHDVFPFYLCSREIKWIDHMLSLLLSVYIIKLRKYIQSCHVPYTVFSSLTCVTFLWKQ